MDRSMVMEVASLLAMPTTFLLSKHTGYGGYSPLD